MSGEKTEGTNCPTAPVLILGLGNELLKDDAVGIRVAERLQGTFPAGVEVRATSLFGLALLDELIGREKVLLIDSYISEEFAGAEIQERNLDEVGEARAVCPHFVGLGKSARSCASLASAFRARCASWPSPPPTRLLSPPK